MTSFWKKFISTCNLYPNHIAIKDRGISLTYTDLKNASVNLGEHLKSEGLKPENIIALSMEKSSAYITALLGCWYAGIAFTPLPKSLPSERQKFILDDLNPAKILNNLSYDTSTPALIKPYDVDKETLAYVIYTSGSTGTPKGVMIEHRGITNFIDDQIKAFDLSETSVSFFHLSINFDASISDIGCALLSGACLVIEDDQIAKDPNLFLKALSDHKITYIDMPPSLMEIFSPDDMPKHLKTIVIGGEASDPKTVRKWAEKFNLVNVYGPTEATVCTSLNTCDPIKWTRPVIGEPLKNVTYYILSNQMTDTYEGELYIGGIQLARGYLNRPLLNQEKFITHNGERLYKTGDRVRRLKTGEIEFLGRIDRQFKIRGQLVEPDEIEHTLISIDEVSNAAVIKNKNSLFAFIVTKSQVNTDSIKTFLSEKLSPWMIPDRIIVLSDFPKTPSGKTDYTALKQSLSIDKTYTELPKTKTENTLYALWQNVLGHNKFDINTQYFDAGGDSLNIMRLSIAAEARGIALPVAAIIKHKTIHKIAQYLDSLSHQDNGSMDAGDIKKFVQEHYIDTLPAEIKKQPERPYKNIFITGATGFLGAHIVDELLKHTNATLYCLYRSTRCKNTSDRIIHIKGDLEKPNLGLEAETYKNLAQTCDAIYHNAAWVNTVLDFETLVPTNLGGCFEVLKFAMDSRVKDIHYASTLSVFVATDQNTGIATENDTLNSTQKIYGGYAQTKWAADWMFNQIPNSTCRIWNYRFGLITGDSTTGQAPKSEFLSMFFQGVKSLGALPKLCDDGMNGLKIDITPIDYAASAMVGISLNADAQTYHIANTSGYSYARLIKSLENESVTFDLIPLEDWLSLPKTKKFSNTEAATYLALCRVLPQDEFDTHRISDLFQATDITFDQKNMADAGYTPPENLDELMQLYIRKHIENSDTKDKKAHG
jgi:amino acid adenylation domain-containing protein/thioester reductase-like protein